MAYKVYVSDEVDFTEESEWGLCPVPKPSDSVCIQSCSAHDSFKGDVAFYRGCRDGKITGLCQRNLPVNWEYCTACSIEACCSCL